MTTYLKPLYKRAGAPVEPLLTLQECLDQLRESAGVADAYIMSLVDAARTICEERTERILVNTPMVMYQDGFLGAIELKKCPVQSIVSIEYLDENGFGQTLAPGEYLLDHHQEPAYVVPVTQWPMHTVSTNSVMVNYVAGYGTAAAVPAALKQWCLLMVAQMYEVRKQSGSPQEVPHSFADELLAPYRMLGL